MGSRRVAVFTGTRAEYGLLHGLMRAIEASARLDLQVIVGGMHLSPELGLTWRDIEADGFAIDARVEMLLASDTAVGVVKSMGLGTIGLADALDRLRPDLLVLLGDRFEALAAAQAALILGIPIAHIHGGEITEGAYDDAIRHAITKMASLHFTAAAPYRRRVIQMGEAPGRVFDVGALGLERLAREAPVGRDALSAGLGLDPRLPFFLVTYHPATRADEDPAATFQALLAALDQFPDHQAILTYPNADDGGRAIISLIDDYARGHPGRARAFASLGSRRYLAALRHAAAVVGNSSSGIIEAPACGVPTVDIGARQGGRLAAGSVIHCGVTPGAIAEAIALALSPDFQGRCRHQENPYGHGDTAGRIVAILEGHPWDIHKRFHDLKTDP